MTHAEAKEVIEKSGLLAAARNDFAKVQALIGADAGLVEAMNALTPKPGEETPQRVAAYRRQMDTLQFFKDRSVIPDLFMACAMGLTPQVELYLKAHPKEADAKGAHGVPLIFHANSPEMVELLIKHGVDPTAALVQLTWSGRVDLMQVAIAKGGKIDLPSLGRRPLHIACAQGHLAAVDFLLTAGADSSVRAKGADWEFKTALGLALMNEHAEVAQLLRERVKRQRPVATTWKPANSQPISRPRPR